MESFAERLCYAMKCRNMRAADLVRATGLNKGTISNYMSGNYEPKSKKIIEFAEVLDVNPLWLMGCDVPMEK